MFSTAKKFLGHVMPGVIRPIHILWNQVIGFFFIVLAVVFRCRRSFATGDRTDSASELALEIPFALLMAGFGIHSFWKARKISKS